MKTFDSNEQASLLDPLSTKDGVGAPVSGDHLDAALKAQHSYFGQPNYNKVSRKFLNDFEI